MSNPLNPIDQGDQLEMVARKFESETLMKVFVPTTSPRMEQEFQKWAGKVEFCRSPEGCGTVIFSSPCAPWVSVPLAAALRPFFEKGGTECNVFEFDVVRNNFVRRCPSWLDEPGRVKSC